MKPCQIIYRIIVKAIIGGYLVPEKAWNHEVNVPEDLKNITIIWDFYQDNFDIGRGPERIECYPDCCGQNKDIAYSLYDIIFDIEFSKALWSKYRRLGSELITDINISYWWEYRRKELMESKDPIKYLEEFL